MTNKLDRLQKVIAQSGLTSRRKAETLITEGKVKVNNEVVTELGTKVSKQDIVAVNGVPILKEDHVYYMLNKPREVISSLNDDKDRTIVTDYLQGVTERVYPIGRLDYQTSGMLLLTNDGEFANLLMHPKHEIEKIYVAKIKGIPSKTELNKLRNGIKVDNETLKIIKYTILSMEKKKNTMILEITLGEGRNRHIRRMMDQLGYPVMKLTREKYGLLTLDGLPAGQYRELTRHEVKQMRNLAIQNVEK
ncbi:MAG TPA: pseudouridine synthase [Virgibacillus sp.]|nr:pseudouridine synthase [Virgibacillus sp.]